MNKRMDKLIDELNLSREEKQNVAVIHSENVKKRVHNALGINYSKLKPKKVQKPFYRRILIAVAMMLLLSIGVGAYYISFLFFAPGYGILKDADFTIYATKQQVMLGNFVVDAVTRTVDETGKSTVCVWLFQTEEIESFMTEEERMTGVPPIEFTDITAVFDDGTEIKPKPGSIAIPGFAQYIYEDTPDTNAFKLKISDGREAAVMLQDISKTEYANLKGIKFGDVSLTVVPLSGTGNIFAGEITDKFTLNISKYARSTSLYSSFFMEAANGETGYASGNLMLSGYNDENKYAAITSVTRSYNMNAEKLMLNIISVMHSFHNYSFGQNEYEFSVIIPNVGENINCDMTLFDAEGIKFTIKNIKNENGVLIIETETTDNVKNKYRTKAQFYINTGIYRDWTYDDYDNLDDDGNPTVATLKNFIYLKGNNDSYNPDDYDTFRYYLATNDSDEIKAGDEIYIQLGMLGYGYQWDKKSERPNFNWSDPSKNLGVINFK